MKKIALLLLAGLSFSFAQAQSAKVGLKAGANYSNIAGGLDEDVYQNKFGFNGGLTANFSLTDDGFLSLQPELLYSQKGYKYRDEEYPRNLSSTLLNQKVKSKGERHFNYLDLPVLLKVNAGGLYFEGGPQLSYLVGIRDNTETTYADGTKYENWQELDKDNLAELEIGYAAGLGFQATNGVSLGIRYNGSINELAKSDPNSKELENARHSVLQLQLGFLLGGGGAE